MKKILFSLILTLAAVTANAQLNTDRLLDMGRNALYFEDYVVSIGYFNQVIESKPHLSDPYFFRAIAKIYLEDYSGCIADCNSALDINPFLPKVYYLRGYAWRYLANYDAAVKDLRKSLEFDPDNKEVRVLLVENLIMQEKYEEAYKVGEETIEMFPHHADTYILLTQVFLMQKDTVRAEGVLTKALEYNKENEMGYAIRGMLRYEKKDYKGALEDLDKAVKLNGFRADFITNRAIIKMQLRDYKGAMADFDQAVKLDSKNAGTYYNRAVLRAQLGDDNNAINDFSVSLALNPSNYAAYFQRAQLYYSVGEYKNAIADYDLIIQHFPDFYVAYYQRGEAKRKLHDRTGAEKDKYIAYKIQDELTRGLRSVRKGDESEIAPTKEAQTIVQNLTSNTAEKYKSEIRGEVQNKDITIEPLANFVIAVADSTAKTYRPQLYNKSIIKVNQQISRKLSYCLASNVKEKVDFGGTSIVCTEPLCFFNRGNEKCEQLRENVFNGEDLLMSDGISAINDLEMAYKLDTTVVYALYNIGYIYMLAKDYKSSIDYYTKAINQYSRFAEAYYNRALIYILQGKKEEARRDLSRAGELGLYGAYNVMKRYTK